MIIFSFSLFAFLCTFLFLFTFAILVQFKSNPGSLDKLAIYIYSPFTAFICLRACKSSLNF